jgi:hypothetical protein
MCHGAWFQLIWTQNVFCDVVEMTPDGGHLHDAVELITMTFCAGHWGLA